MLMMGAPYVPLEKKKINKNVFVQPLLPVYHTTASSFLLVLLSQIEFIKKKKGKKQKNGFFFLSHLIFAP